MQRATRLARLGLYLLKPVLPRMSYRTNVCFEGKSGHHADSWPCPLLTHSHHSGGFPLDRNHVAFERAGALDSDGWGSTAFSLTEGANGGDASASVTAMICCWHESPSAIIRSNAPPAQF